MLAASCEDVRYAPVGSNHHSVSVHKRQTKLLGQLLAYGGLANSHGAHQNNGMGGAAIQDGANHYRPTESKVAGMLSR
ncbi:hypothetical protein GCM10010052_23110 [Paenarthrobacter histidinolovorans]|nr:hypothetical protein GCM10010052_23110 [Paenarthrobacter histidinolovorans]